MPFDLADRGNGFPIIQQKMTNWCWAACTVSVCNFYNTHPGLTQQRLVSEMLSLPICDSPRLFPICNKTLDFGSSLQHVGHLTGNVVNSSLTQDEIFDSLQDGSPVGCQMEIPSIGGHAVLVISAKKDEDGNIFLHVADPSDASILTMSYSQLRNNFRGLGGRWIRTYFTTS